MQAKVKEMAIKKYFYSRKEAAAALAVSVRKIDYMISEQTLRTRRHKGNVLIPAEDMERVAAEIMADKHVA